MSYKFYGRCDKDLQNFTAFPGQIDSNIFSFNILTKKIKITKRVIDSIQAVIPTGNFDSHTVLIETNDDASEVINFIQVLPNSTVETTVLDKVKKYNLKYYKGLINEKSSLKHFPPIPENVFIDSFLWTAILS